MKILVFSDSHGNEDNMIRAVERERPFTLDAIVHLGDGWRDAEALHRLYPRIPLEQVPGNCDSAALRSASASSSSATAACCSATGIRWA